MGVASPSISDFITTIFVLSIGKGYTLLAYMHGIDAHQSTHTYHVRKTESNFCIRHYIILHYYAHLRTLTQSSIYINPFVHHVRTMSIHACRNEFDKCSIHVDNGLYRYTLYLHCCQESIVKYIHLFALFSMHSRWAPSHWQESYVHGCYKLLLLVKLYLVDVLPHRQTAKLKSSPNFPTIR